jgi:hypothetical protein
MKYPIRSKLGRIIGLSLVFGVSLYACADASTEAPNPVIPPEDTSVSFALLSSIISGTDTNINIRVSWKAPNDPFGAPEFYRHTMTASKVITDSTTGNLPNLKQVSGLTDTVRITLKKINDTVTLTSNVWSVRRGLQSTSPAIGKLFVRRGDRAPLPPDSIRVDTIVIPEAPLIPIVAVKSVLLTEINKTSFNKLFPTKEYDITQFGNTTYITIHSLK